MLISTSIAVTAVILLGFGTVVTWKHFERNEQKVSEASQEYAVLYSELQRIRKSYSQFLAILDIEMEEPDDERGKGGPEMPELTREDIPEPFSAAGSGDNGASDMSSAIAEAASLNSDLHRLVKIVHARKNELAATPSIWPVRFEPRSQLWISSKFRRRKNPFTGTWEMHQGIDVPAPRGTPLVATADGVVTEVARDRYLGNYVKIRHGEKFSTLYGHMKGFAEGLKKGTAVRRGQVIGYVGRSGRSTGSHVHYEVRVHGKHVNPEDYILN